MARHSETGQTADVVRPDGRHVITEAGRTRARGARRLTAKTRLDLLVGGIVLLLYTAAQIAFLQGPHPFDPAKYFKTAVDFPHVPADLWTLRIGLIAPVRLAVLVFGPSEAALYAVPFATGIALAAAVYGTALLLFKDRVVAAAAALVTVLNTNYLLNSSHIFPDTTATAVFTAAFLCLLLGAKRSTEQVEGWAPTVFTVAAGVLFGWAYLTREFSPLLFPAALAAVVMLRYPVRRVAILAGAAVLTFCLDPLYGLARYGDPLVHAQLLLGRGDRTTSPERVGRVEHIVGQLNNPLDTVLVFPRLLLSWSSGWAFLLLIAIFVVALGWVRDKRLWLLAPWFLSFWIFMAILGLGTLPSGRWILNITNIRYWSPIFPPLVIGAFGGLALLVQKFMPTWRGIRLTPVVAAVVAALVLVPGFVEYSSCAAKDVWRNDPGERWKELRAWFGTEEAEAYDTVWSDGKTQRLVPAFTSTTFGHPLWHGKVEKFKHSPQLVPATDVRRSLILIHKDRFQWEVPEAQKRLDELRREWAPVFVSHDGRMILLAHKPVTAGEPAESGQTWWILTRREAGVLGSCGLSPYEPGG